jgi:ribonuclease VapC
VSEFVLDASALLALLQGEPGAERVFSVLDRAAISAVNLAEVVSRLAERGLPQAEIRHDRTRLPLDVVAVDEDLGYAAGFLRPSICRLGLSLGDRICIALASRLGATVLTADRNWRRLGGDVRVELLRRA